MDPPAPRSRPDRIELRHATPEDLAVMFAFQADGPSCTLAGVKPRDEAAYREHWEKILADSTVTERIILADGEPAGRVTCFVLNDQLELGYWIGRAFWGLGVARRAVGLFLTEETRRPIHAHVSVDNPASVRVLERHGFVRTGQSDEPETERYLTGTVLAYRLG